MSKAVLDAMSQHMDKTVQALQKEFAKLRTGRASPNLVDAVQVDYYGSNVPISQVANVTTPDARTIQIVPWEATMLPVIEKSILAANIGFNPQSDGKVLRIPLPALTEERRKEMVKMMKKMGEESKVAIRNNRRDANEEAKKAEKNKEISGDEQKKLMEQIQKKTDDKVAEIEKIVTAKKELNTDPR
jgi:ribosome recycling factor